MEIIKVEDTNPNSLDTFPSRRRRKRPELPHSVMERPSSESPGEFARAISGTEEGNTCIKNTRLTGETRPINNFDLLMMNEIDCNPANIDRNVIKETTNLQHSFSSSQLLSLDQGDEGSAAGENLSESYRISLSIFKNLDEKAKNNRSYGSQNFKNNKPTLRNGNSNSSNGSEASLSTNSRSKFTEDTTHRFSQSLYGTVRLVSTTPGKSFPMAFHPKSCFGIKPNHNASAIKRDISKSVDKLEDEGIDMNGNTNNLFHGEFRLNKQNPTYVSDNEEEKGNKITKDASKKTLKILKKVPVSTAYQTADKANVTSEYDSIGTIGGESVGQPEVSTNITFDRDSKLRSEQSSGDKKVSRLQFQRSTSGTASTSPRGPNVMFRCLSRESFQQQPSFTEQNLENDSVSTREVETMKSGIENTGENGVGISLDAPKKCGEEGNDSDNSKKDSISNTTYSKEFNELITTTSSTNPILNFQPATDSKSELSSLVRSKNSSQIGNSDSLSVRKSGQMEVKVTEKETITTVRHRARSSMIFKRREKLISKAAEVAREFHDISFCNDKNALPDNNTGNKTNKPNNDTAKQLTNMDLSQTNLANITTFMRSRTSLDGINQTIKVDRKEKEVHIVDEDEASNGRYIDETINHTNNHPEGKKRFNVVEKEIIYARERPVPGSMTKEYVEIFLNATKFNVEINNIVACETVTEKPKLLESQTSTLTRKNSTLATKSPVTQSPPVPESSDHPLPSPSDQPPSSSSSSSPPSSNDVYKLTSVHLIKTTTIDMSSTDTRRQLFDQLLHNNVDYSTNISNKQSSSSKYKLEKRKDEEDGEEDRGGGGGGGGDGDGGDGERFELSEDGFAVLCQKLRELADVESN